MEHRGGHVVPLKAILGEILNCGKEMVEEIDGGIRGMPTANILDAIEFKVLTVNVAGIGEAIGAKQEGVAGQEFQGEFVVGDTTEEAGRDTSELEGAAFSPADEERSGHASADNAHLCTERIDDGVLNGAVASGDAAEEEPLVENREDAGRSLAGLVDAAEGAHGESGIEGSWEAFAGDVAKVEANGAVGKEEIIQVIAAYHSRRLEFVRNGDVKGAQRLAGQHDALDGTGFLEILLA